MGTPTNRDIYQKLGAIDEKVEDIKFQVKDTTNRVSKLELDQARQEGRDSVIKTGEMNWKKIALALIGIISTSLAIAYTVVQSIF